MEGEPDVPIYEYRCTDCSHRFEVLVRGSATPQCPECGANRLEKQLSVFAVGAGGSAPVEAGSPCVCHRCGDPRGPGACGPDPGLPE